MMKVWRLTRPAKRGSARRPTLTHAAREEAKREKQVRARFPAKLAEVTDLKIHAS